MGVRVVSTGSYVPDAVLTNDHLHHRFGFDSDWIVKRTGILERPPRPCPTRRPAISATKPPARCIAQADVKPTDIDCLILATFTPDMSFPSTACLVQDQLKLVCPAFDVQAACAGFMYALITGFAYVASGASDLCLVIGGDANSRVVNPNDIKTYPLFGDGAGAVLLAKGKPDQGILAYSMGADGSGRRPPEPPPPAAAACPPTPDLLDKGPALHAHGWPGPFFRWARSRSCATTIQDRPSSTAT